MGHILGEIAYVDYIEKENGAAYLARVKKYIRDVGQKIQYFPELVKEYNSNLFFVDLEILKYYDIQKIQRTEEYENFEDTYKKRREYILKHGIEDICDYKNWPEHIIFSE
jgi:hypothetical protein